MAVKKFLKRTAIVIAVGAAIGGAVAWFSGEDPKEYEGRVS